jgi:hypothetical protein
MGRFVYLTLLLVAVSCSSGKAPDEPAFAGLVADYVLNDRILSGDKIVVFDEPNLAKWPTEVRSAVLDRLEAADVKWMQKDLNGDVNQLPGLWEEPGPNDTGGRINRTHILLHIDLEGMGDNRHLEWGRHCGPTCGSGGTAILNWDGERWEHARHTPIVY